MNALDRRLNAYRDDLADQRLAGQVAAARFCEGRGARIAVPVADLHRQPRGDAGLDTQMLLGDGIRVFDEHEGWCWVQAVSDGYVGYMASSAIRFDASPVTHRVAVPRTFTYPGPDMKMPRVAALSMGSGVSVTGTAETRGTRYALLATGEAVVADHLKPLTTVEPDFVAVAERLENTPYLWGGASGFGVDCSGLVQLSMRMAGRSVLRDTDMQAGSIGSEIDPARAPLQRGDLVFWSGHVAIVTGPDAIIHASGAAMLVARERLSTAVERIARLYGRPTIYRRP